MIRKVFVPNSLFSIGPVTNLNACVGENGGPYDLVDYGEGFFRGAQEIIVSIKERDGMVDLLVYPACFSFRHGIELYLKAIVKQIFRLTKSQTEYDKNHNLCEYFTIISSEICKIEVKIVDDAEVQLAKDIVDEFFKIDPTGQVFRYPEDIKGNSHLIDLKIINVGVLSEQMSILHDILESMYYKLEDMRS